MVRAFRSIVKCFYFVKKDLFCDTAICHSARVTEEFHEYKSDLDFIHMYKCVHTTIGDFEQMR